jgi:vacuolar protein sorting-associated protein 11
LLVSDAVRYFFDNATSFSAQASDVGKQDDESENDELEEIMEDIQEALVLARRQGVLPHVRIARILAGEPSGQFSSESFPDKDTSKGSIPLSVALDYVGSILEESHKEISRLTAETEEYNTISNAIEMEIEGLLRISNSRGQANIEEEYSRLDIDNIYAKIRADESDMNRKTVENVTESFWREMNQSEDSFDIIARFFAKGIIN